MLATLMLLALVGFGSVKCKRGAGLDHACEPRRQEEADGAQQAHHDEHPQEDAVDHHGNVLPVFFHLQASKRQRDLSFIPFIGIQEQKSYQTQFAAEFKKLFL